MTEAIERTLHIDVAVPPASGHMALGEVHGVSRCSGPEHLGLEALAEGVCAVTASRCAPRRQRAASPRPRRGLGAVGARWAGDSVRVWWGDELRLIPLDRETSEALFVGCAPRVLRALWIYPSAASNHSPCSTVAWTLEDQSTPASTGQSSSTIDGPKRARSRR